MKLSYYPGCTLKAKGKDLEKYALMSAKALGMEIEEIKEWQCCGAVYPQVRDEVAQRLGAVRAIKAAADKGQNVVTLCAACYNVLKQCHYDLINDEAFCAKVNAYEQAGAPFDNTVVHFLEVLRDTIGFDKLSQMVKNPLTDTKIAAYYGCLLLRPSAKLGFDDAENPTIMEDFIRALGATPVIYAQRNECCGGYCAVKNTEFASARATEVVASAKEMGADMMMTACPLCLYNLKENSKEKLPVVYFTELLAKALGVAENE